MTVIVALSFSGKAAAERSPSGKNAAGKSGVRIELPTWESEALDLPVNRVRPIREDRRQSAKVFRSEKALGASATTYGGGAYGHLPYGYADRHPF
jgi:hypothetical protein